MGAGIPQGRFIEVIGENSTAKTALLMQVIAAFQNAGGDAILLEPESKLSRDFAETLGVSWDDLGYHVPDDLNDVARLLARIAKTAPKKRPIIVGWDSIASTPGIGELDEAASEEGLGEEKMKRARKISSMLRAILLELSRKNVTLIGINQLRTKVDFRTGYSGVDSTGGKAIKYHTALRLNLKNRGRIKHTTRKVIVGIQVEIEAIKNSLAAPFRKTLFKFRFESGFDKWFGLDELLIDHGRIESAGGWLSFRGKKFRKTEMEQIATEMPELIAPIIGTVEEPQHEEPEKDQEGEE